jgi:hypothetical protein
MGQNGKVKGENDGECVKRDDDICFLRKKRKKVCGVFVK